MAGRERQDVECFVRCRLDHLVRTAYLLTGSLAQAEDLVQTALLKCIPRWDRITGDPLFYVRSAVVHEHLSLVRRLRTVREIPTDQLPEASSPPAESLLILRRDLTQALAQLSARQRTVLVLRYFEDLPINEVATIMKISSGTVRSQAHDAIAALRRQRATSLAEYIVDRCV